MFIESEICKVVLVGSSGGKAGVNLESREQPSILERMFVSFSVLHRQRTFTRSRKDNKNTNPCVDFILKIISCPKSLKVT